MAVKLGCGRGLVAPGRSRRREEKGASELGEKNALEAKREKKEEMDVVVEEWSVRRNYQKLCRR